MRAVDLVSLEQSRGGWRKGCRAFNLALYAQFLRGAGALQLTALQSLRVMASNCVPPYPSDANDAPLPRIAATAYEGTPKRFTNAKLVKWLGIEPHEARALELVSMLPDEVKAEQAMPAGGIRGAKQKARRAMLLGFIQRHGMKSVRTLKSELSNDGLDASTSTINSDLAALGLATVARKRAGRPKNEPSLFEASKAEETARTGKLRPPG